MRRTVFVVFLVSACLFGCAKSSPEKETEQLVLEVNDGFQETSFAGQESDAEVEINAESDISITVEGTSAGEDDDQYLSNLDGIEPGTILNASLIDFDGFQKYFMAYDIVEGDAIYQRINGRSYTKNNDIELDELVYLKIPHYNFDRKIQVGELIVNKDIQDDIIEIFKGLFLAKYQIQSMFLVDNYWTGNPNTTDTESIDYNNTSAFNYRPVTGGSHLSNHAYGRAIDLNPQQNPYVSFRNGEAHWAHRNADDYIDRTAGLPHMITHDDLAYILFIEHGFEWGGDWSSVKDYQHFEKDFEQ